MGVIHWRLKNILIVIILIIVGFGVYQISTKFLHDAFLELVYGDTDESGPCNKNVRYIDSKLAKKWPAIGLLGPPGSGVIWLRYMIEHLSGIHTGSTTTEYADLFNAEGKTKKVVVVMSHDITTQYKMQAAIIVYSGMKETVRSQFATKHSDGTQLEARMENYYGKDWESFAVAEATLWNQRYKDYVSLNLPFLVINADDLEEMEGLKRQLLHISHFLHVPIRHNVLDCLVERGTDHSLYTEYRPKPLRYGFHPFELLAPDKLTVLDKYENYTETRIGKIKEGFLPRVHVK